MKTKDQYMKARIVYYWRVRKLVVSYYSSSYEGLDCSVWRFLHAVGYLLLDGYDITAALRFK